MSPPLHTEIKRLRERNDQLEKIVGAAKKAVETYYDVNSSEYRERAAMQYLADQLGFCDALSQPLK